MSIRFLTSLLVVAALITSAATGCGSDDSSATTLPKDKYAQKADLICGDASVEQSEIATVYFKKHPNAQEIDLVEPAGIPPLEKEIEELKDLGLPRGQEAQAEAFLEESEIALEALKEEPKGALAEHDNPYNKANELGEKLGLGDCSRNP
jgi:hypothetical protein